MLEDGFWKTIAYRGSLYEQAHAQGVAAGKSGEALAEHIADKVHAPEPHMHAKAVEEAKYAALQTDQTGTSKQIQKALSGRIGRWIVPFYKTPANALFGSTIIVHLHRFGLRASRQLKMRAVRQPQKLTRNGRLVWVRPRACTLCTQMIASQVVSAQTGASARPTRDKEIKPYHIRIGDTWYPYNTIEPVATLIGLVADGIETANHPDTDDATAYEISASIAASIGYNLTNKTFMASVSNFIDTLKDPDATLEKFLMGYAAGMFPASSMMNEFRRF